MPGNAWSSSMSERLRTTVPVWVGAHLYHHDDLDELLRVLVSPLVEELRAGGWVDDFFFVRYWQGGRHVRLRLRPSGKVDPRAIEDLVTRRATGFFAGCGAGTAVDPAAYARCAAWLVRHEFGPHGAPVEPLQPDNVLRLAPYVAEAARLGGPAGVAAFEPHFTDSSEVALAVLTDRADGRRRLGRGVSAAVLAAAVFLGERAAMARFFDRCRRDWLARLDDPDGGARRVAGFEQRYQRQRETLRAATGRLLAQARRGTGEIDPLTAHWLDSVTTLRERLAEAGVSTVTGLFQCLHKHHNRLGIGAAEETYLFDLLHRTLAEDPDPGEPR